MARVVDQKQQDNLDRFGIEIQTKYLDGDHYIVKSTLEKNSDSRSVENGIILEKIFFRESVPVKRLDHYDSRVQYRFITSEEEERDLTCPNCGYSAKGKAFVDGCPYCNTFFNMEYKDKKLGTKHYYDLVMKGDGYLKKTFFVSMFFSLFVMLIYIVVTGRTFNQYDIAKVIVGGVLLGIISFAVFYILDAFIVTLPIRYIKEKQNKEQQLFWERMKKRGIDKNRLFNNFIYELSNHIYEKPEIIDYNIVDYVKFEELSGKEKLRIGITLDMRIVSYENEKNESENRQINVREEQRTFVLEKRESKILQLEEGVNIIECPHCGASVKAADAECEYCGAHINRLQEWFMPTII